MVLPLLVITMFLLSLRSSANENDEWKLLSSLVMAPVFFKTVRATFRRWNFGEYHLSQIIGIQKFFFVCSFGF